MVIRCAPQVCLVFLPGGLTLEVCYDHIEPRRAAPGGSAQPRLAGSQSVWLLRHDVLLRAEVGQA
jgi:hypothetical protein